MKLVRFVHLTDTHIGPTKEYVLNDTLPYACAQAVISRINQITDSIDFVVHTGDVGAHPIEECYLRAKEIFSQLKVPVYFLAGNHDGSESIRRLMPFGPCRFLPSAPNEIFYEFDVGELQCIALDAQQKEFQEDVGLGIIPKSQLDYLQKKLAKGRGPVVIFLHYPPVILDSPWAEERMRLLNRDELMAILKASSNRIKGVFFGHVHRSVTVFKEGIPFIGAGSTSFQITALPKDNEVVMDPKHVPIINLVTIADSGVIIKNYTTF